AGTPVALNPDSITGKAFTELAEHVVEAVEATPDQARRVRVQRH
ncbi:MAG: sodium:proton antiporter, partial [Odoribacter laneus]